MTSLQCLRRSERNSKETNLPKHAGVLVEKGNYYYIVHCLAEVFTKSEKQVDIDSENNNDFQVLHT